MKSKVLIIPSWYPTEGKPGHGVFIKRHVLEIARLNEVTVLYFDFAGGSPGKVDVKVNRVNDLYDEIIVTLPPQSGILSMIRNFILTSRYFVKFSGRKGMEYFDIIHLHVPYHIGVYLWPWLMFSQSRLIITEHWSGYFIEDGRFDRLSFFTKYLLRRLFARAYKVTAVSKALASAINAKVAPVAQIEIIPNVINCNIKPRPVLAEFHQLKKFLFLGNLNNTEKNISGIIEAFALASNERNDLQLIIAGGGQDEMMLRYFAKQSGLDESKIQFRGFVSPDKLPALYAECVCLILNSHFETFSIAAAESILYGVPVISTRCYGPEEFIDDTNGILIERGDETELIQAFIYMTVHFQDYNSEIMSARMKKLFCVSLGKRFSEIYVNKSI